MPRLHDYFLYNVFFVVVALHYILSSVFTGIALQGPAAELEWFMPQYLNKQRMFYS